MTDLDGPGELQNPTMIAPYNMWRTSMDLTSRTLNPEVVGSIPSTPTSETPRISGGFVFLG